VAIGIVFRSHLLAHLVTFFFFALLHGHEESVYIGFVRIDGKGLARFQASGTMPICLHRPFIISTFSKVYGIGSVDGFRRHPACAQVSQFPIVEFGNGDLLASEETVIRTVAKRSHPY
jgi:hypothetical protein